jgi:membrane protease YdiL (CAAX protease family)
MFERTMDTKPLSTANPEPATSDSLQPNPSAVPPAAVESTIESPEPQPAPGLPTISEALQREFPLRDVFVGPEGLYPGTRWLIYLALVAMVFFVLDWVTQGVRAGHPAALSGMLIWEINVSLAAILPAFAMSRLEQRSFADFGLPGRQAFRRNFWIGALWGTASLTALMLVLHLAGGFEFGSLALHGTRILKYGFFYAVLFLATGFFEEFLFRGYSQWVLSRGMHFWPAAALLSVGFGAIHSANPGEAKTGLIAAGLIGFFFCLTLRRTGSLWWAIGFHASWDWGESFLYSVPDSGGVVPGHLLNSRFHGPAWLTGGSVGPEGSLLIFVLLAMLWILFDRMHPQVRYEPS